MKYTQCMKKSVELADLLLLFIYLEVIQMIRECWTLNRITIVYRYLLLLLLLRLIILQGKTMDPSMLLYGGAILLIAIAVLILKARKLKIFADVDD